MGIINISENAPWQPAQGCFPEASSPQPLDIWPESHTRPVSPSAVWGMHVHIREAQISPFRSEQFFARLLALSMHNKRQRTQATPSAQMLAHGSVASVDSPSQLYGLLMECSRGCRQRMNLCSRSFYDS